MKMHLYFLTVAASVMFALQAADAKPAIQTDAIIYTDDLGPNVVTQLKPTVPPHAPRRFERTRLLVSAVSGGSVVYVFVPTAVGETDVMLTNPENGNMCTVTLDPGFHAIPFEVSGTSLHIHAIAEYGVTFEGNLGEE